MIYSHTRSVFASTLPLATLQHPAASVRQPEYKQRACRRPQAATAAESTHARTHSKQPMRLRRAALAIAVHILPRTVAINTLPRTVAVLALGVGALGRVAVLVA